jgi:hypothetical protein
MYQFFLLSTHCLMILAARFETFICLKASTLRSAILLLVMGGDNRNTSSYSFSKEATYCLRTRAIKKLTVLSSARASS